MRPSAIHARMTSAAAGPNCPPDGRLHVPHDLSRLGQRIAGDGPIFVASNGTVPFDAAATMRMSVAGRSAPAVGLRRGKPQHRHAPPRVE